MKYELVDYYNVSYYDGEWDVNVARTDLTIDFNDSFDEADIINELKRIGYLTDKANEDSIDVDMTDSSFIELFSSEDCMPLCRLELIF